MTLTMKIIYKISKSPFLKFFNYKIYIGFSHYL